VPSISEEDESAADESTEAEFREDEAGESFASVM
jgi:hypothetical protein